MGEATEAELNSIVGSRDACLDLGTQVDLLICIPFAEEKGSAQIFT